MRITIHAPERKLPERREFDSQRIHGVTWEYDERELPADAGEREKFIDAVRRRQVAEMDRQEAFILGRAAAPARAAAANDVSVQAFMEEKKAAGLDVKAATVSDGQTRFFCVGRHRGPVAITEAEYGYSNKRFGKALCRPCQAEQNRGRQ